MKKGKKSIKLLDSVKKGLKDIKLVLEEGNYKLFLKQLIVIILLIFAYRYVNTMFHNQKDRIAEQIEAVHAQENNEQAYLSNKKKLLELEPRFPDLETKNDWLLRQVVAIFKDSTIQPSIGSSQSENTSNNGYTVVSLPVSFETSYHDFGKLLASIENRDEMLRVSEFSIDKQENENSLGSNDIKIQISTIFPKEKIAKTMFKEEAKKAEGKK